MLKHDIINSVSFSNMNIGGQYNDGRNGYENTKYLIA